MDFRDVAAYVITVNVASTLPSEISESIIIPRVCHISGNSVIVNVFCINIIFLHGLQALRR
jgi:hypothetical protein